MWEIFQGNCLEVLDKLEPKSVQVCITSPPYFSMRDYQALGQFGQEKTPEDYVENLVNVFRKVRTVLRDDGVLWLVLGDCYCGSGGYSPNSPSNLAGSLQSHNRGNLAKPRPVPPGYSAKDLIGIPWQTALALRQDKWVLRCDVIWEKGSCLTESVKDRPTRCHEYVFLLSKNRKYYYDHEAIREDAVSGGKRNKRSVWKINNRPIKGHTAVFPEELVEQCVLAGSRPGDIVMDPFVGSGTAGVVANRLGRNFIGIDLNPDYCQSARKRIESA